ncbi:tetratricopeptide repeat protein [Algiphilus sp.]|uniref:tetratricopeptide repeat protein n=1 Tax=Algiphilus sp. TaxID=1872431 RepID=UPI003B51B98B
MTGTNAVLLALLVAAIACLPLAVAYLRHRAALRMSLPRLVLALSVLFAIGLLSWMQYQWREDERTVNPLAEHAQNPAKAVGDLAESLEYRLERQPEQATVEQWALLARSFEASRNHVRAAGAYAQANEMTGFRNPDLLVAEAQARLRAGPVSPETMMVVRERARQAMEVAPMHPGAHYLAGDLALRDGALAEAVAHFEVVYAAEVLAPSAQSALQQRLQEWRAEIDGHVPADLTDAAIAVQVDGPESQWPEGAALFVYARRPGETGMPLAAKRIASPRLPASVRLQDSDRLREGPSLLSYDVLEIGARLSASGAVAAASDDLSAVVRIEPPRGASATLRLRH